MPDRGVRTEGVVRVFRQEMITIISDGFQILIQAFMEIRLFKTTVQFQDALDEVVNFIVLEFEVPEEMTGDTQEIKSIDGFFTDRR